MKIIDRKSEKTSICIGIMGAALTNPNMGVNALGCCILSIMENELRNKNMDASYIFFSTDSKEQIKNIQNELSIKNISMVLPISLKKISVLKSFVKAVKKCDLIIDITGGDSFSDIYGDKRFIRETIGKTIANKYSKVVYAPQTIGPYKKKHYELYASWEMKKTLGVFARDEISYKYAEKIGNIKNLSLASDIAFLLPYEQSENRSSNNKIKVGVNVSALIWHGGYTQNNQFGLSVDYKEYIHQFLNYLADNSNYEVHLIPHVFAPVEVEDDYKVCKDLSNIYPNCIFAGKFSSPMEAKSYISKMDVFIGGRMHSTIAAFSSGVATIPVSYSRKFEGLYHSIGYKVGINCRSLNTDMALNMTKEYLNEIDDLKHQAKEALKTAKERLKNYTEFISLTLQRIKENSL